MIAPSVLLYKFCSFCHSGGLFTLSYKVRAITICRYTGETRRDNMYIGHYKDSNFVVNIFINITACAMFVELYGYGAFMIPHQTLSKIVKRTFCIWFIFQLLQINLCKSVVCVDAFCISYLICLEPIRGRENVNCQSEFSGCMWWKSNISVAQGTSLYYSCRRDLQVGNNSNWHLRRYMHENLKHYHYK